MIKKYRTTILTVLAILIFILFVVLDKVLIDQNTILTDIITLFLSLPTGVTMGILVSKAYEV